MMKSLGSAAMVLIALLASGALLGCGQSDGTPADDAANVQSVDDDIGNAESPSTDNDAATTGIAVQLADRDKYDEIIGKHKGKVVLVDFWATWCPPCVAQFPHTVELSKKSDPKKLAIVSVSMDEPDDVEKVQKFLQDNDATFDNLISKYGIGQEGFAAFEITDGAVPHYKVYDREGNVRHTSNSNQDIDQLVEQLANEE